MRMFGLNIKEIDVAKRAVAFAKFRKRDTSRSLNAWFRANPQSAKLLARRSFEPAFKWLKREARKRARNRMELRRADVELRAIERAGVTDLD